MAIITLKNVTVSFGNDVVLDETELVIEKGERVCLTGRNGSGKSTLLKVIDGEMNVDGGQVWTQNSLVFSSLEQDLPEGDDISIFTSVASTYEGIGKVLSDYHDLVINLSTDEDVERLSRLQHQIEAADAWSINHHIESILDRMGLEPDKKLGELSGGWLKRVAIARSLVAKPDVWLLDEPTNHLDIPTIQWLEEQLLAFDGTIVFITHDRQLMQSVATSIFDIDRGKVTRWDCGYQEFIERRDHQREVEVTQNRKFDDKLRKEEVWIRQGIKARRTRNEGRVRDLEKLREERSQRRVSKNLKMEVDAGSASGKIVKELKGVSKSYGNDLLIDNLSLIIQRQDRIGLIGPNGIGKTTLLKILLENLPIDKGEVKTGTKLDIAYFDQARAQLNPEMSVKDYISEGREYITIGDKDLHVVSYLTNFMFSGDQARAPIRTLSGGEQNRLLLARLFSQPANLLVLDEPTNDLDVESLELLEELLMDFKGTVIIVSHDRSFMDNVVSSLLVFEGNGVVRENVGGYSDWISSGGQFTSARAHTPEPAALDGKPLQTEMSREERKKIKAKRQKLEKELAKLPGLVEKDEAALGQLQKALTESSFYQKSESYQAEQYEKVRLLEVLIESNMNRWEELDAQIELLPAIS
ncbi:MAG: ATP-binding cassette subfamily F protein uup [Candidatus Azotimanducaceae bacterium]